MSLLGFDPQKVDSQLTLLKAKLQSHQLADLLDINMNAGQVEQQLMLLKRRISDAGISDLLDVNLNEAQITRQLGDLEHSGVLREALQFTPEFTGNVDLSKIPVKGENIPITVTDEGVQAVAGDLGRLASAENDATVAAEALGAAAAAAAGSGGGGRGGGMAALGAAAGSSGRALYGWGGILRGSLGVIGLWHLALDLAVEGLVATSTAALAAAAGIAAMTPAAKDIYTHLQAVQAVNSSLGSQIPPLTGQFEALADAMAPQTIEAYGGALNLVNNNAGVFAHTAREVVTMFDDWIARLDIWSNAQRGVGGLLQAGTGYLAQFGHILGEVGIALDNLLVKDPGTAHFLLDILGAAGKLLDLVTSLPAPILETALAMHSWYVYGGAALGVLGKLPGPLGSIGKALGGLGHGQMFALAALAAGAFELARAWDSASSSVQKDISGMDAALSTMPASQAITQISADVGKLNQQMQAVNIGSVMQQWHGLTGIFQLTDDRIQAIGQDLAQTVHGSLLHQASALGDVFKNLFDEGAARTQAATVQVQHDVAALNAELQKLQGQQGNLFGETGNLIKQGYSYSQSLALMDLAGVKAGDSLQLMNQKVANLITGYKNMSVQGPLLAAAVNAVTFASALQSSKVSQLNAGWDAFFQTVSGGESGFEGFAQQTIGLYQSMAAGGLKLSDSSGKVSSSLALLASQAGGAKVSMTGLNSASLLARQTFVQSASSASTEMDNLTTLAAAAGLGSQGTDLLARANKDLVASLLPAAQHSADMTTILYALAQRGGYTGANSFQQLAKWVGNTRSPMSDLQGVVQTLTKAAGNLNTDVQNLSTALGTTLNDAMATAIFDASGGQKVFDSFATAVLRTGADSTQTQSAAANLASGLLQVTGSASDAKSEFETFAQRALGMTRQQADILWQQSLPALQKTINGLHGKNLFVGINAAQALNAIGAVENSLSGINSKTVDLYVNTYNSVYGNNAAYNSVYGRNGKLTYATGGIVGHAAAGGVQGGLVTVGELGPELAQLPQGTRVWPHGVMPPGVRGGDGGSAGQLEVTVRVQRSGNALIDALMKDLRVEVRRLGGDPLMFQKKVKFR